MDHIPNSEASPDLGYAWFFKRVLRHSSELCRLAAPVVISRAGILSLTLVDTVMLGPLGAEEVARYGLGTSVLVLLLVFGIGLLFGTVVETSQLRGEGRISETGHVWRRALPYACILGVAGLVLTQFSEEYFHLVGQPEELARISGSVAAIQGLSLLPVLIYVASNFFLEAMGRPIPGMVAIWTANAVNIPLNLVLMDGALGVQGADGVALATVFARVLMMVMVVGTVLYLGKQFDWGLRGRLPGGWIRGGRAMRRHGYASGSAYAAESGAYHAMHIFAGWMATAQLAAFTINMNLFSMIFMMSLGIANATAVRVGVAHGRRDWRDRALAGWTGCFWVMAFLLPIAYALAVWPSEVVSSIYRISDPTLIGIALPVTIAAAAALVLDGGQFTLANALRGASDAWIPTAMNIFGFIGVMIPTAYVLGILLDRGARGLFEAIFLASLVVFLILLARWIVFSHLLSRSK